MPDAAILAALADAERSLARLRELVGGALSTTAPGRSVSLQQAAGRLNIHQETMRRYAERYSLGRKVGGRWRFTEAEIDGFAEPANCGG